MSLNVMFCYGHHVNHCNALRRLSDMTFYTTAVSANAHFRVPTLYA